MTTLQTLNIKPYRSPWWGDNRHLQTVIPNFIPVRTRYQFEWEELALPDGDFVDIAHVNRNASGPIVFILHGLEGSIHSFYIKHTLNQLVRENYKLCVVHFRGCSGRINRSTTSYHGGYYHDFEHCVERLKEQFPDRFMYAIGYSLGGCVVSNYLSRAERVLLDGAVAISMPFDLGISSDKTPAFYLNRLLKSLKKKTLKMIDAGLSMPIGKDQLAELETLREFDDKVTAPIFGFASAEEYYGSESVRQYLSKVKAPILILHAKNDPFVPEETIPVASELSDRVRLHCTRQGGHCGFAYGRWPWRPRYWAVETVREFLGHIGI